MTDQDTPNFMNVRQVAGYLQLNEKKVYALLSEGKIPATKITGKWMFPRHLVDQWMIESSHGGVFTDRLNIVGGGDLLLQRVATLITQEMQDKALLNYSATGTQLGLSLLSHHRADVCLIHWGPHEESAHRHPALIRRYAQHRQWTLVRMGRREQGLLLTRDIDPASVETQALLERELRWVMRQEGSGSQRFLQESLVRGGFVSDELVSNHRTFSEREAASLIAAGYADIAPGARSSAQEFGLNFKSIGWEALDFVLYRETYFRTFFRTVLERLGSDEVTGIVTALGGYDLGDLGRMIWSE
ncbi:MAG: substrate-binding domain-containing protein [Gammaproteobacteria bacterium]